MQLTEVGCEYIFTSREIKAMQLTEYQFNVSETTIIQRMKTQCIESEI